MPKGYVNFRRSDPFSSTSVGVVDDLARLERARLAATLAFRPAAPG